MSSFTQPLILEALDSERNGQGEFLVYQEFSYDVGYLGSGETITVPAGFNTDLATIPWFARGFISLSGRLAKPALLHDWLLFTGDPRAHDVFDEAMVVANVGLVKRKLLSVAVRFWQILKRIIV